MPWGGGAEKVDSGKMGDGQEECLNSWFLY